MDKAKNKKHPCVNYDICVACGVCIQTCPISCLGLTENVIKKDKLTAYPILVDKNKCISCGFCKTACPVEAIKMQ